MIAFLIHDLLSALGENPDREGLKGTPARVEQAWKEWAAGYKQDPADVLKSFEDGAEHYKEFVFQGAIPFYSHCEHHMAPFFGVAHIGYVPDGRIVGLSKLTRLLEIFTRRLQVQERIARQVADSLMEHIKPLGAGVVLQGRHLCMESRGIHRIGTITTTSALRGVVREEPETRAEFLSFVSAASQGVRGVV
jgi:GTP cyclohydrolase I